MQNKTLLVLFTVFVISCFALAVSAFSFGSSDKKNVGAQEIVKRGGDKDDDDHKHGHDDDDHEDKHEKHDDHDKHDHDDEDCDDCVARASASFEVGGKTYKIPCGTGVVDIDQICTEAVIGTDFSGGVGSATLVFGTGSLAITSAVPCGTGTNNVDLNSVCNRQTNTYTLIAGTVTSSAALPCGPFPPIVVNNLCDPYCAGLVGATQITETVTATVSATSAGAANILVTVGTGTGATVQTVSCPTAGPQAVTIGTGTAATTTTVTC